MINVLISSDSRYPVSRPEISSSVEKILLSRHVTSDVEVSILICGSRKALEIAKKFLRDDKPHNVLSFPFTDEQGKTVSQTGRGVKGFVGDFEGRIILGDIVVCYPIAQQEANQDGVLVMEKVCELVEHGMLHLLGEHHEEYDTN